MSSPQQQQEAPGGLRRSLLAKALNKDFERRVDDLTKRNCRGCLAHAVSTQHQHEDWCRRGCLTRVYALLFQLVLTPDHERVSRDLENYMRALDIRYARDFDQEFTPAYRAQLLARDDFLSLILSYSNELGDPSAPGLPTQPLYKRTAPYPLRRLFTRHARRRTLTYPPENHSCLLDLPAGGAQGGERAAKDRSLLE